MSFSKRLLSGAPAPFVNSKNFKAITYTGNGGTQAITGLGFQPDFVWIKNRDTARSHLLVDSSRGRAKNIYADSTSAETTSNASNDFVSFDTDGFTVGATQQAYANENGDNYVAWCWKAGGGTTSSNTDGSITSTVQANQDAGFSIVKYTGTFAAATVGHGLSAAPEMIIVKNTDSTTNWWVWHTDLGGGTKYLKLNGTDAVGTVSSIWNSTVPTSTVFSVGNDSGSNGSGNEIIAYCFHSVDSFSKIGSYTGNGSTDGPIIETGFEPAFVMVKNTSTAGYLWLIADNKRQTSSLKTTYLQAQSNAAEYSPYTWIEFLSNGFQLKNTGSSLNANGDDYIYMAFAADPDTEAPTLASSFNTEIYTGAGAASSVTGLGFSPSLIWGKNRNANEPHWIYDTLRGPNKLLESNSTIASTTVSNRLTGFESDGFTIGGSDGSINGSGVDYVAWAWKADDNESTIEEVTEDADAIAVYKFESNANDVTGNHNGTATDVTYVSGKFNNAADFNNTSSKVVIGTQSSVIPSGSTGVSFSFWVYLDSVDTSSNYDHWFIGQENYGGSFQDGEFSIRLYEGKVYTDYGQSSTIYRQRKATTVLSTGQWYHIVATYDTSNPNITEVYLNGSLETISNLTSGGTFTTNSLMQNSNNISIGGGPTFTDGKIDQFRIYDKVLNAASVTNLYNETVAQNSTLNIGTKQSNSAIAIVSANANAGFSISQATFAGKGIIPHGLSQAPEMVLLKGVDSAEDWQVYHSANGTGKYLKLNTNAAVATRANSFSSVTATTVTNQWTSANVKWIMYSFHSVSGYSKFGTYTGNGSATGPSVTTGFKVDWLMIKRIDGSNSWAIHDSRRVSANPKNEELFANLNDAENEFDAVDFLSNGFQIKNTNNVYNASSASYLYWAVAKNVPSNTTLANSFKTVTYSGTGNVQSITGTGFRPDFVWLKGRTRAEDSGLFDTVRVPNEWLRSSTTDAQNNFSGNYGVSSFDSDGFTIGTGSAINNNGSTFVGWAWKAGNTWQSNLDGSIPSTVNANTANGFSIIKYTGDGSTSKTVGHGLSSAPEMVFVKRLDSSADWYVWATPVMSITGSTSDYIVLNSSAAKVTAASVTNLWGGNVPSATTIGVGDSSGSNASGGEYIAYCWHSVSGYSKIGSYTGNGSTQSITGLGFQPDWLIIKQTNASNAWRIFDSVRGLSSPQTLYANLNYGEDSESNTVSSFDSDGFTMGSQQSVNDSGDTYIYMAFKMN
jgi:hypothetical protein